MSVDGPHSFGAGQGNGTSSETFFEIDFSRQPEFYALIEKRLALMEQVILAMGYTVDPGNRKIRTQSAHHMTSTCRMGKRPEDGVVDENLRVHGTDNLYVCSNAVFPTGSAVNPTLTLTTMSLRLGDYLAAGGG